MAVKRNENAQAQTWHGVNVQFCKELGLWHLAYRESSSYCRCKTHYTNIVTRSRMKDSSQLKSPLYSTVSWSTARRCYWGYLESPEVLPFHILLCEYWAVLSIGTATVLTPLISFYMGDISTNFFHHSYFIVNKILNYFLKTPTTQVLAGTKRGKERWLPEKEGQKLHPLMTWTLRWHWVTYSIVCG